LGEGLGVQVQPCGAEQPGCAGVRARPPLGVRAVPDCTAADTPAVGTGVAGLQGVCWWWRIRASSQLQLASQGETVESMHKYVMEEAVVLAVQRAWLGKAVTVIEHARRKRTRFERGHGRVLQRVLCASTRDVNRELNWNSEGCNEYEVVTGQCGTACAAVFDVLNCGRVDLTLPSCFAWYSLQVRKASQ
jgi:hypothetical protein